MKRFMSAILAVIFINSFLQNSCFAAEKVSLLAREVNKEEYIGKIDGKILGKFYPVYLTVKNNSEETVKLPKTFYFADKNDDPHVIPDNVYIYEKTRLHMVRRAIIWGILGLGVAAVYTVPASISHTMYRNPVLKDSIEKNNFRKFTLLPSQEYSSFVFIPEKYKSPKSIVIKDIQPENGESFDIKTPVSSITKLERI